MFQTPKVVRKNLEKMYIGTCNIIVYEKQVDPTTKRSQFAEVIKESNVSCRLSFSTAATTGDGNTASVAQNITLFLAPEVTVPDGSKIVVTQNGKTKAYTNSSEPRLYDSHQEIALKLFERWS